MIIRPAKPDDYDAILQLWQASGLPISAAGRDTRQAWRAQLAQFPTCYLVAQKNERIIGVVLGTHDVRKGWINRLAVHPDFRRSGVARELITACESAFAELGIEIFTALVEPDNVESASLFSRCGYDDGVSVIYFRKLLRPDI